MIKKKIAKKKERIINIKNDIKIDWEAEQYNNTNLKGKRKFVNIWETIVWSNPNYILHRLTECCKYL